MKTEITLTVQPTRNKKSPNNRWRLGLNTADSKKYFCHYEIVDFVLSDDLKLTSKATCGTSKRKKAFDFNSNELSKWIVSNEFHNYIPRKPSKLEFKLHLDSDKKMLEYIPETK